MKTKWIPVLLLLALPAVGLANAGRLTFAFGDVQLERDGRQIKARRGLILEAGDTVRTGSRGRAQLRFRDGGYLSLQPDTVFRVDEYRFSGQADGSERSFFSLLKGGLRAITGLIGHRNRASYQLRTPTVTIGIRGTEFGVRVDGSGQTFAWVGEGEIELRNDKENLVLGSWQSAKTVAGVPRPGPQRPLLPLQPLPVYVPEYRITDDRNETGEQTLLTEGSISGAGGGQTQEPLLP